MPRIVWFFMIDKIKLLPGCTYNFKPVIVAHMYVTWGCLAAIACSYLTKLPVVR